MAIPAYDSALRRGAQGPDTALAQTWLNGIRDQCTCYAALTVDGRFGAGTENAVREFQTKHGLTVDGVIGAATWNALYDKYALTHTAVPYPGVPLRSGMAGAAVRYFQQRLAADGAALAADGRFGAKTAAAVRSSQARRGLTADGVAGKATWAALA